MARRINWWVYHGCRMISYTPYYINLGEFGIAIPLTILASRLIRGNWTIALWTGATGGVGIFVCYGIAYGITNGLISR